MEMNNNFRNEQGKKIKTLKNSFNKKLINYFSYS